MFEKQEDVVVMDSHLVRKDGPPKDTRPEKPKPVSEKNFYTLG